MEPDVVDLVMAQLTTALGVVGKRVLTAVEDDVADASAHLGMRLLARLRRGGKDGGSRPQLEAAVTNAAAHPDDEDFVAGLRAQVKLALSGADEAADPGLGPDLTRLLETGGVSVSASGKRAVAVNVQHNRGIMSFGDNAKNTQNHN